MQTILNWTIITDGQSSETTSKSDVVHNININEITETTKEKFLNLKEIDKNIEAYDLQLEILNSSNGRYDQVNNNAEIERVQSIRDKWGDLRAAISTNLDNLGYVEIPVTPPAPKG